MIRRPGRTRGRVSSGFTFTPKNVSGLAAWYAADSLTAASSPNQVSGLVSWFRADTGITRTNGAINFPWAIDNTDTFAPNQSDPDGGFGAYLFRESTATGTHTFYAYPNTVAAINGNIVFSVYAKYSGVQWLQLQLSYLNSGVVYIDVQNGVVGTIHQGTYGNVSVTVTPAINGWNKYTFTSSQTTAIAFTSAYIRMYLTTADNVSSPSFTGDGTSGVLLYNPQETMDVGQRVSGWTDQAPGADATHNLAQGTTAAQPTLTGIDSAYGNQATLGFASASSECLLSGNWSLSGTITTVVIGNFDGTAALQVMLDGSDGTNRLLGAYNNGSASAVDMFGSVGMAVTALSTNSIPMIIGAAFNGASSSLYVNSNAAGAVGDTGTATTTTGISVGSGHGGTSLYLNGKIAEVMIYNRVLTQAEIQALEMYAASRYGLPISIGTMKDKSGTGDPNKNLAQATQTKQPTIKVSDAGYNGKASLSLASASSQFLQSPAFAAALASPYTMFAVGNDDGTATAQVYFDDTTGATGDIVIQTSAGSYLLYNNGVSFSGGAVSSTKRVLGGVFNGAASALYINAKTAVATGTAGTLAFNGMTLGGLKSGTSTLNGKIAEVLVYSRALTTIEINRVLSFLGKKYGIAIGS